MNESESEMLFITDEDEYISKFKALTNEGIDMCFDMRKNTSKNIEDTMDKILQEKNPKANFREYIKNYELHKQELTGALDKAQKINYGKKINIRPIKEYLKVVASFDEGDIFQKREIINDILDICVDLYPNDKTFISPNELILSKCFNILCKYVYGH